jgi:hypothetical protein
MFISLSPLLVLVVLESISDFTTRALPELLYADQLYHIDSSESTVESHKEPSTGNQNLTDDQLMKRLCPNVPEEQYYSYRYEPKSKKCDTVGYGSLCGNNMILYGQKENTVYGYCDCASILKDRTLIYHPETNQCYYIFQKAYCREGEWLTLDELTGKPICKVSPCRKQVKRKTTDEFVYVNYNCVLLGSTCEHNKVIRFVRDYILPKCAPVVQISGFAIGAMQPSCAPGSYISMAGNCQSSWKW